MMLAKNQKERKLFIQNMISNASPIELELVWIPKIISNQTPAEVSLKRSLERNSIGLTGFDDKYISNLYSQLKYGEHLTPKQTDKVRNLLKKYWKQYLVMMNT